MPVQDGGRPRTDDCTGLATGVVGAGLMGIGIAVQVARAGGSVHLLDTDPGRLAEVLPTAQQLLDELAAAGLHEATGSAEVLARLTTGLDPAALGGASWVVEAVPERLDLKHLVYSQLEDVLDEDALLSSNTSGILPSALAAPLRNPRRFLVTHFWNPPHAVPLVEVVPAPQTDQATGDRAMRLLRAMGSRAVLLKKELPGFIGNRLQYAVLREALAIMREGVAGPEEIDLVMTSSLGRRYATTGPLMGADLGGLDTFREIAGLLMPELAKDEDVLDLLDELLARGRNGWRSGAGLYDWSPERLATARGRRDQDLLERLRRETAEAGGTTADAV